MPKKTPVEVGNEFISNNEYLKKIMEGVPADQRDNVLSFLGTGAMRQDEFSRAMDAAKKKEEINDAYKLSLDDWYGKNLDVITRGAEALDKVKALESKPPAVVPPVSGALTSLEGYVKKDEVEKLVSAARAQSEETGLQVFSHLANLTTIHLHKYGVPIDANSIVAEARKNNTSLDIAFASLTKEKEDARSAEEKKKETAKLRADIEAELRQKLGNGAYPVGGGDVGVSPALAGLGGKPAGADAEQYGAAAAVNEYYKMNRPAAQ